MRLPDWAYATAEDGTRFWVDRIEKSVARDLIVANHYSHKWNTAFGTHCFGVFDGSGLAGALVFGNLMNPGSFASIADLPPDAITELNRMWIDDRLGPNTETACLARSMRWLRANTSVQLVQTFADGRLGCGTVHKAANFGYYGYDETLFFADRQTGQADHATPFTNTAVMRGMIERNSRLVAGHLDAFIIKTYRYLYPLTKYARRRIILKQEPYPQYDRGQVDLPNYRPPASQIARCAVMSDALGYRDESSAFYAYLADNYEAAEVAKQLEVARNNEWISPLLAEAEAQPDLFGLLDGGAA